MRKFRMIPVLLLAALFLSGCGSNPYEEGIEQLEAGKYKEAEASFKQSVKKEKHTADAYRGLGIALWEQQDYEGAKDALANAVKEGSKKNGTLCNLLGSCELELGNYKKAVKYYKEALEDEKNSKELLQEIEYNLIVSYEGAKNWEEARERLEKYIEKYPDDKQALKEQEFLETR